MERKPRVVSHVLGLFGIVYIGLSYKLSTSTNRVQSTNSIAHMNSTEKLY